VFDQALFKRDVSPIKVHSIPQKEYSSTAFNLDKYLSDLDKKFSRREENNEYLLRENQELMEQKFDRGSSA